MGPPPASAILAASLRLDSSAEAATAAAELREMIAHSLGDVGARRFHDSLLARKAQALAARRSRFSDGQTRSA